MTDVCVCVSSPPVENSDHCDFTILRDMLIRYEQGAQTGEKLHR